MKEMKLKESTKVVIFLLGLSGLMYVADMAVPIEIFMGRRVFELLTYTALYIALFITLVRVGIWMYRILFKD
ncbi:MAG: hypothetical protein HFI75_14590 [Lachnospiraceae bacterium]|nr:hypothetical protein [Lachnospiraceae bacterium]